VIGLSDPFTIAGVDPSGLAAKLGLRPGERLLAINDVLLHDEIDFAAQSSEELLRVRVRAPNGTEREVEGRREYGIPFGAEFEARQPKRCHNNCVFCFVYQHPKGVRRELLIKDDDYVFSFEQGVLKPHERIYQIVEQRSGCREREILFLDDKAENVEAGAGRGWQTICHTSPEKSIPLVRELIS